MKYVKSPGRNHPPYIKKLVISKVFKASFEQESVQIDNICFQLILYTYFSRSSRHT